MRALRCGFGEEAGILRLATSGVVEAKPSFRLEVGGAIWGGSATTPLTVLRYCTRKFLFKYNVEIGTFW